MPDDSRILTGLLLILLPACQSSTRPMQNLITVEPFGRTTRGTAVQLYELRNRFGLIARVTNYGATLVEMHTPDRENQLVDVVLGFEDVAGYQSAANQYFGCTTGRVANRIAKGRFTVEGVAYSVAVNNGPNHLHGGSDRSLDKVVWQAREVSTTDGPAVEFTYTSPHLEEGYPGELQVTVVFMLTHDNELRIDYTATADCKTPVNLTNHTYWNLGGAGSGDVLDQEISIAASRYTPTDSTLIPTGQIAHVEGTPLDLRRPTPVGRGIPDLAETPAGGYDHNFVLDKKPGSLILAARLHDPQSGRTLEISTTEPAIQFYSGNFLRGDTGKDGRSYGKRHALCLETQHYPDSVNHSTFPSIILAPGETYRHTTVHRFSAR